MPFAIEFDFENTWKRILHFLILGEGGGDARRSFANVNTNMYPLPVVFSSLHPSLEKMDRNWLLFLGHNSIASLDLGLFLQNDQSNFKTLIRMKI